jgi:hypothetical protein
MSEWHLSKVFANMKHAKRLDRRMSPFRKRFGGSAYRCPGRNNVVNHKGPETFIQVSVYAEGVFHIYFSCSWT